MRIDKKVTWPTPKDAKATNPTEFQLAPPIHLPTAMKVGNTTSANATIMVVFPMFPHPSSLASTFAITATDAPLTTQQNVMKLSATAITRSFLNPCSSAPLSPSLLTFGLARRLALLRLRSSRIAGLAARDNPSLTMSFNTYTLDRRGTLVLLLLLFFFPPSPTIACKTHFRGPTPFHFGEGTSSSSSAMSRRRWVTPTYPFGHGCRIDDCHSCAVSLLPHNGIVQSCDRLSLCADIDCVKSMC